MSGVGQHHDPARHGTGRIIQRDAALVALDGPCAGVVDRHHLRAVARRRQLRASVEHLRDFGIDAVDRRAVGLFRDVDRLGIHADQAPFGRRLDRHLLQLVCGEASGEVTALHDVGVTDGTPSGRDHAVARRAGRCRHAEQLGAFLDQRRATGGAGLTERLEALPHRPASAGDHGAPLRVGVDVPDMHARPVRFQFVRQDTSQRRADMLAHFGANDVDGDAAIGGDFAPRYWARRHPRRGRRPACPRQQHGGVGEGHHEAASSGTDHEGSATRRSGFVRVAVPVEFTHDPMPPAAVAPCMSAAASLIALRMRT